MDTLARSHSEPRLKKDSQLAPALFIDTKTCSHSGGPLFLFSIITEHSFHIIGTVCFDVKFEHFVEIQYQRLIWWNETDVFQMS